MRLKLEEYQVAVPTRVWLSLLGHRSTVYASSGRKVAQPLDL